MRLAPWEPSDFNLSNAVVGAAAVFSSSLAAICIRFEDETGELGKTKMTIVLQRQSAVVAT